MDDENELLGPPDDPEIEKNRVLSIFGKILSNEPVQQLTAIDVQNVELAIEKIQLHLSRQTALTEEDILNVKNLNFFSPRPQESTETLPGTSNSRIDEPEELEELDYNESLSDWSESQRSAEELAEEDELNFVENGLNDVKIESEIEETAYFPAIPPETAENAWEILKNLQILKEKAIKTEEEEDIIYLSSDSESEDAEAERDDFLQKSNVSQANFIKHLSKDRAHLKMKKLSKMPPVDSAKFDLTYPLGVTFDTKSDSWYITNQPYFCEGDGFKGESKIVKIYAGCDKKIAKFEDIKDSKIQNPSAITVYKEGSQIAVLCSDNSKRPSIRLIDLKNSSHKASTFCSYKDRKIDFSHPARGLARTIGGNLITMDRPPPEEQDPRLRVFRVDDDRRKTAVSDETFVLSGTSLPSFIATSGDTVVITDLGKQQTVILIRLDDSKWKDVKIEIIRVISATGINLSAEHILNTQYFTYVAGAQIDQNGNVIIADAKNHHFKLFEPSLGFIHRVSTDFPVPYVSSFHVNHRGECLILSIRDTQKVHFARLSSTNRLEPHIKSGAGKRQGVTNPLSSKRLRISD
ncbi:RING-type domain-containing protein [Caenorhabditis elegans]|uniref:RING-type domain-containing protein n=1 Tax=Caenorhabditis elegans TaxID=6239 RepID=O45188_CAEEL|nr:RING-type domain-containing protein [Caenorhabditis elegans]CCD66978.1 RING-type domain-containing protein [Caenorhabditis elegans]|eukprot:NP_500184.1 Uncharacterized protein CELE_M70.5 [Caenorhabditis elegans]